jgi:amino acid transporter
MIPYFMINENAPMPEAFRDVGWNWARYLVAIGAICSLSTSLLGAMFPLPRVLYAIASDGLIYKFLAKIQPRLQTPLLATILSGFFAAFMAMIFDLDELVNMMSIGTLLAYSLVAISVLVLRYQHENVGNQKRLINTDSEDENVTIMHLLTHRYPNATQKTSRLASYLSVFCSIYAFDLKQS